jgi:hypothetical protein
MLRARHRLSIHTPAVRWTAVTSPLQLLINPQTCCANCLSVQTHATNSPSVLLPARHSSQRVCLCVSRFDPRPSALNGTHPLGCGPGHKEAEQHLHSTSTQQGDGPHLFERVVEALQLGVFGLQRGQTLISANLSARRGGCHHSDMRTPRY